MADFDPPSLYREDPSFEQRCEAFAAKFVEATQTLVDFLKANGGELASIKESCKHGQWGKFLKKIGLGRRTADRWVANWTSVQFEPFDDGSEAEPLPRGFKKCQLCTSKTNRDPLKCPECKNLNPPEQPREPHSDPDPTDYLAFWERIGKTLGKRIRQMRNALIIPRQDLEIARKAFGTLQRFINLNAKAPIKPQEAGKCKKCGKAIIWLTTEKHGRVPLEAKPGGGLWEIVNGIAVYCVWDKEAAKFRYRAHSNKTCVGNKPISDDPEQRADA